jgi:hypothetical protein
MNKVTSFQQIKTVVIHFPAMSKIVDHKRHASFDQYAVPITYCRLTSLSRYKRATGAFCLIKSYVRLWRDGFYQPSDKMGHVFMKRSLASHKHMIKESSKDQPIPRQIHPLAQRNTGKWFRFSDKFPRSVGHSFNVLSMCATIQSRQPWALMW